MKSLLGRFASWRRWRRVRHFVSATLSGEVTESADIIRVVQWLWTLRKEAVENMQHDDEGRSEYNRRWFVNPQSTEQILICNAVEDFERIAYASEEAGCWRRGSVVRRAGHFLPVAVQPIETSADVAREEMRAAEELKSIARVVAEVARWELKVPRIDPAFIKERRRTPPPAPEYLPLVDWEMLRGPGAQVLEGVSIGELEAGLAQLALYHRTTIEDMALKKTASC